MTDQLRKSIESIRRLSPELNKATDDAARVVSVVEKFLGEECGVGIEASKLVHTTNPDETDVYLEYRRHNGKFRLIITENVILRDEEGKPLTDEYGEPKRHESSVVAWTEASRQQKLAAFAELPGLLDNIAQAVEQSISSTNASVAAVEQITASLSPARSSSPPIRPRPSMADVKRNLADDPAMG